MQYILLFFILLTTSIQASVLNLSAEENCPYACNDQAKDKGFVVDIITQVYKQVGYEVIYTSSKDYKPMLEGLEKGEYDLMIGVSPSKDTKLIYMKKPLGYTHNVIAMPKYSKWTYSSDNDLKELQLAVIKELIYSEALTKHIKKFKRHPSKIQILSGHLARKHNLKKLRFDKVTAIIDDRVSLRYFYFLKKKPFGFKIVHTSESMPIHIAFAPKGYRAKKYATLLYKGLKKLKGSQELKDIMKKYGLSEGYIRPIRPNN
ncbi:MAG: hypothetical protein COA44_06630 [Arcobacter sp.]|nr:MAG: hypothetical protein COA44_06630 [Arcobacter sp.]